MQVTCVGNNLAKKHVWLKLILRFFGIFCIYGIKQKYSNTIMYECEKSLTHELSYSGLLKFSHLILFHGNVMCKK
jgi:hypothetical protein